MLKIAFFFCLFSISGCQPTPSEFHHSSLHFGTLIDITLYDVSEKQAELAFEKLDEDFAYMHAAWSPWERGSLRRVNGLLQTGKAFSAGPSVLELIKQSKQLAQKSDGLFNPAIGKLINLWQMHKHQEKNIQPPSTASIKAILMQRPSLDDIEVNGVKIQTNNPSISLNFGAFAKGYAIDLEISMLKKMGINNAIINTGGDLKAIGSHGDRPWNIAIKHPRKNTWLAQIETSGEESVFTSGDYERYYLYEGKRYHHILDPRTGFPANQSQSVTVLHHDSGLADAAATALFIAGPDSWLKIAKQLDIDKAMLIDINGKIHVTPAMNKRLTFNPQIATTLLVTSPL